jgi:hypothetical protein
MDVNDKVKELEDELKLLKAGIQNVLLDIRENVLERKNPLADEQSAHLTLDVNTTARAMAAEAAAGEARKATEAADPGALPPETATPNEAATVAEGKPDAEVEPAAGAKALPSDVDSGGSPPAQPTEPEPDSASQHEGGEGPQVVTADGSAEADTPVSTPVPTVDEDMPADRTNIPDMFMADLAPLSGDGSLADWVTSAIDNVGVEDLRRVITMFRLWGNVPPNISRALAHLQELLASSDEPRPSWLKVLQDLDKLASL